MAERPAGNGEHPLAQNAAMGVVERERRVVADRADVAEVIGDALELGHHPAQHRSTRRHRDVERRLDRAREGEAVGDGGIAGDSCDDAARAFEIGAGEQAVDALVHVAQPLLEANDDPAVGGEAEMAGFDDAGVHRADRNLVQALAVHGQKRIIGGIAELGWGTRAERRSKSPGAMIEPRPHIGQFRGLDAVQIADRPFEPQRRRMMPADARVGPVLHADRDDQRGGVRAGAQREMHMIFVRPQREQIGLAFAERPGDRGPGLRIHHVARPRTMPGNRRTSCKLGKNGAHRLIPIARRRS